jgi:hypothetical protein
MMVVVVVVVMVVLLGLVRALWWERDGGDG